MEKTKLFTKRKSLALGIASALLAMPSYQTIAADTEDGVERIEVTGSRIKRTDIEGPSPVQSISKDDIANMGYDNLQQLLERMPVAGSGTFSTRGNNQDSTANGGAAVSLRGLGPDATLVLINGRRASISAFAESITNSFVDINSIPVSAIERIDILKDGASAIYGSDAVAGVVNIILKKDIEGIEVNMGIGATEGPNYEEQTASLVWGTANENSHASIIIDYFKNSELGGDEMGRFGTANQEPYGGMDFRSSRGYPGYFYVDGVKTIDPDCPADRATASGSCLFDYGPYTLTIPAAERVGAIAQFDYTFSNDVTAFTEIAIQHNTSEAGGAPTPLDEDAQLTVPGTHPDNPFGQDIEIGRYRTVDAGPRRWDIESDTLRMVLGLKGQVNDWDWEASVQKGRSKSLQTGNRNQGWVRVDYLQQEIDAGNYNPFGGTTNPDEVIDRITTSLVRRGDSHLTAFDAHITGEAFTFNDDPVMMAAGIEYRDEDVKDIPDDQFQRGLIFGTESVAAQASRDQWAAYVEFSIPLTEQLELQLAGRYDDYSDFGDTTNPKVAIRWNPHEDVTVRASWAEGFRAPSLSELLGQTAFSATRATDYKLCAQQGIAPLDCKSRQFDNLQLSNDQLGPEESTYINAGIVYSGVENLTVKVDYFDLEVTDLISAITVQDLMNADYAGQLGNILGNYPNVSLNRDSEGRIDGDIVTQTANGAVRVRRGIDAEFGYKFEMDFGSLELKNVTTYLLDAEEDVYFGGPTQDFIGFAGQPDLKNQFTALVEIDDFSFTWTTDYTHETAEGQDLEVGEGTFTFVKEGNVDSFIVHNISASYSMGDWGTISGGVRNLLEEEVKFDKNDQWISDNLYLAAHIGRESYIGYTINF